MRVDVERATRSHAPTLRNLMQLYAYDFSEILGLEVDDDGRFVDRPLDPYWDESGRFAYLLRAGGRIAGFALVQRGSRLSGDMDVWDMAEFFVLRRHRRAGIGTEAARQVITMNPGRWEIRQRRENTVATAFWRRLVGALSNGAFVEAELDDHRWRGPVQSFTA